MKIYLVGGAVRDQLLGIEPQEKDYVVVGATVDDMLKRGYRQVGKDFPVFLDPEKHEEYALARLERKIGRGYTGFEFDASSKVTLEEDLIRRDLTINAMAQDLEDDRLIDPYQGQIDLDKKLLRHVSEAFVEDPVRILRVARFASRFAHLGFQVAPETMMLMKQMVESGEVDALVPERVWRELERALSERNPEVFFTVLSECGALQKLFSDLKSDNIDVLKNISPDVVDAEIRFAVLLKGFSVEQIQSVCDVYRIPSAYRELALLLAQFYSKYDIADKLSASELLDLFQATDAFRREERFDQFLQACFVIDHRVKDHLSQTTDFLRALCQVAKAVKITEKMDNKLIGKEIGHYIYQERIKAIDEWIKGHAGAGKTSQGRS